MTQVTPFLMFQGGVAEEAVRSYLAVLPGEITVLERSEAGAGVSRGEAVLSGLRVRFFDSPSEHAFGFTPALSMFVDLDEPEDVDRVAAALGAEELMPPGEYGFSCRFAWVNDRYGVSWQLNAPFDAGA